MTHYDYGFRIYNPGIGKFLSVDPLSNKFPYYSPYQYAGNKPIIAKDLDGLEPSLANTFDPNFEPTLASAIRTNHAFNMAFLAYEASGLRDNRKDITALGELEYFNVAVHLMQNNIDKAHYGLTQDQKQQLLIESIETLSVISDLDYFCRSCFDRLKGERDYYQFNLNPNDEGAIRIKAEFVERMSESLVVRKSGVAMMAEGLGLGGMNTKPNVKPKKFKFHSPILRENPFRGVIDGQMLGNIGESLSAQRLQKLYPEATILRQVKVKFRVGQWFDADVVAIQNGKILHMVESKVNKSPISSGQRRLFISEENGMIWGTNAGDFGGLRFNGKSIKAEVQRFDSRTGKSNISDLRN